MSSKTRNVALLLPAFVLATGLAFAQPGVKLSTVNQDGTVTTTTLTDTSSGPTAKAPTPAPDGSAKYWDGLGLGGASTNYFTQVPYIVQTPNPQIAAGPDDILTIVNRTISRYPNPNAAGNTGTLNPYNYPPTEFVPLDVWMGLTVLGTQAGGAALCPSGTGSNSSCVIDNASVRYDQLQGRYLVLFTVTDLPSHRSNWVLVVSTFSQFQKCPVPAPAGSVCPTSSPLFTPPVIAPIVGGTQTGGQNSANWVLYTIPINLLYNPFQQPSAMGLIANAGAVPPFNNPLANSAVGTPNVISSGGSTATFLTTPFCTNGGPALPLTYGNGAANGTAGGTGRTCTNYYPTGARFGIDNDNIILTAPVLDMAFAPNEGNFPSAGGQVQGKYAGTRVTSIAKIQIYNGKSLVMSQPGPGGCTSDNPIDCQAVNLADNTATGTLTAVSTEIAFAQGAGGPAPAAIANLQYGVNGLANSCVTANPVAVASVQTATAVALSCAPLLQFPTGFTSFAIPSSQGPGLTGATLYSNVGNNFLAPIFWEPDNLRGRALASFDAQVAPFGSLFAGVITPIDYMVGTLIDEGFAAGQLYIQPIVFSCPAGAIFSGPSGVTFCGSGPNGGQSLVADLPFLGTTLYRNAAALANLTDPAPVGQGFSAAQMTTSPSNVPVSPTTNTRLFIGDSRPEQVMFREGLLYVARNGRVSDLNGNFLGTSTVVYDILKTCATVATLPSCGSYSITGGGLVAPATAFEYFWENGLSVPDPNGNINGFGFYAPMFDVPADVIQTGPISPISTLQLFDKLFVGMTTGGTSNVLATFSKDFPSLWDFRPGDDAFDTVEPYLDPYTGVVLNSVGCPGNVTVSVLSKSGNTITVSDPTGLGAGMFLTGTQTTIVSIAGNVVTLSAAFSGSTFPASATFSRVQPIVSTTATLVTPGSATVTVASTTGLAIGQALASAGPAATGSTPSTAAAGNVGTTAYTTAATAAFGIKSLTNVGLSESISGLASGSVSTNTVNGSAVINVATNTPIAVGETVTGTGIPAGATVTNIQVSADGTFLIVTLSATATATGATTVKFDSTPCFPASKVVATTNSSAFVVGGVNVPGVTASAAPTCSSFIADPVAGTNTGQAGPLPQLNGIPINNGIGVNFAATGLFPGNPTIINIVGNTITLSAAANAPLPGLGAGVTSTNLPLNFVTNTTAAATVCPMIPFSPRGGASTDPNDGSLWLYGEFAKNRLSTIPGPGQWGTSVANYALSFPATDPYGNDNTYFQDVQPTGSADSAFFTWIQLAKNLGLAVPSATGPCTINNGVPPILQPPASGTTPNPSPSTLGCPYFGPDTIVTRAEMAYWVVKSIMDETMISNYLCATGGDPSGIAVQCNAGIPASTFADLGAGGGSILNPFLTPSASNAALGIAGVTNAQLMRYIEVMARRGITKGCSSTIDPTSAYCPNQPVTRAQMAVFLVRAKMDNVFPTTLSGIPLASPYGDNFGNYLPPVPYFSDVTANDPVYGPYYIYIQKMRELRITNGTGGATFSPGNNLTRKEIATFIVRAFFL